MYQLMSCVLSNISFYVIKQFKCFCKFRAQNIFKRAASINYGRRFTCAVLYLLLLLVVCFVGMPIVTVSCHSLIPAFLALRYVSPPCRENFSTFENTIVVNSMTL